MDGRDQRGAAAAGVGVAGVEAAGVLAVEAQYGNPGGHGFAAENANHLLDLLSGRSAELVGFDNAPHGADRMVDGVFIQSKFGASASVSIDLCFDDAGKFRYWNSDGTPMLIEVARDQYDAAIQAMRSRISRGQVEGITDPDAAEQIIKKSPLTYRQVRNIARAGNAHSLLYDAGNGVYVATTSLGISAGIRFAQGVWSGESKGQALRAAFATGVKTFGVSFVAHVLAAQLGKAGLNRALTASSEKAVRLLGTRVTAFLVNGVRSSKNIYGAAALSNGARIVRGNVIASAASFVVLSMVDFTDIARRRISPKQLLINLTGTAAGIGGGAAGALAGAAVGSAVPGPGTLVGGVAGFVFGAVGGHFATKASHALVGLKLTTDRDDMTAIVTEVLGELGEDYVLTDAEFDMVLGRVPSILTPREVKRMYASADRRVFAADLLEPVFTEVVAGRAAVSAPTERELGTATLESIGDAVDGAEAAAADSTDPDDPDASAWWRGLSDTARTAATATVSAIKDGGGRAMEATRSAASQGVKAVAGWLGTRGPGDKTALDT